MDSYLVETAGRHLGALCAAADRRPGSAANVAAASYVERSLVEFGWAVGGQDFPVIDWATEGGSLAIGETSVNLSPAPYGLGAAVRGPIRVLDRRTDLARTDLGGSVVVMTGELAVEPLTPKGYPFYGSEEHAGIVSTLEEAAPAVVIGVTGRQAALCGALDPFPLIEDGAFGVPAANVRPQDAKALLSAEGQVAVVEIRSHRWQSRARNVIGEIGRQNRRITVIAHLDTKPGTPGAVDNAAGVVVLLLLAELLGRADEDALPVGVELLAVNGEDHYAAPGEVAWLDVNGDHLDRIELVVNVDGAGFEQGRSAWSTYNLDGLLAAHVRDVFTSASGLVPGPEWWQSDHAIFAMRGRPAVAVTSERLEALLEEVYHSSFDTPERVEVARLVELAAALERLVLTFPSGS